MKNLFLREYVLRKKLIFFLFVVVFLLGVIYIAIYPSLQHQATKLISSLGQVYKNVGIEGKVSFTTLQGYLQVEMFAFTWPIIMTLLATSISGNMLAGEIEKGTIGMLLAQPFKRSKIYLTKYLFGLIAISLFILATFSSLFLMSEITNLSLPNSHFINLFINCFLFGTAIFSLGIMVSAILSQKSLQYFIVGIFMLITYITNAVAGLNTKLDYLKYLSLMHYFNYSSILAFNKLPSNSILVLIIFSLTCLSIGLLTFNHRDISI